MASSSSIQILLAFLFLLIVGASARPGIHFHPCKTLFISYTLTSTDRPQFPSSSDQNPNPNPNPNPSRFFAVYRIIRPVRFSTDDSIPLALPRPTRVQHSAAAAAAVPSEPLPYFGISNSLRERAKDILVVVVGLLFGVGCGALTAATMYLAWSLLTNRYEVCGYGYDDDDDEDEIESQKKMGYASIPPAPATPASPVKEGFEGN